VLQNRQLFIYLTLGNIKKQNVLENLGVVENWVNYLAQGIIISLASKFITKKINLMNRIINKIVGSFNFILILIINVIFLSGE